MGCRLLTHVAHVHNAPCTASNHVLLEVCSARGREKGGRASTVSALADMLEVVARLVVAWALRGNAGKVLRVASVTVVGVQGLMTVVPGRG